MPDHQLAGEEGEVFAWQFENAQGEAEYLADLIAGWIRNEQVPLSEIAVLVSKQLDLYANHLMVALEVRGIPYRNEQEMQELFDQLFATKLPYHDVHGRPTIVRLSKGELERKFGR